jgi:hypothetical protein
MYTYIQAQANKHNKQPVHKHKPADSRNQGKEEQHNASNCQLVSVH